MYRQIGFIGIILGLFTYISNAQTATQSGWVASFNTFSLSHKWSVHLDVQMRSSDNLEQFQTLLFRPGINYQIRKNQFVTAGYAYVPNRYYASVDDELLREHRLWQQYLLVQPIFKTTLQHRFRFEERFLPISEIRDNDFIIAGTNFTTRFRYFTRGLIPLKKHPSGFTKGSFAAIQNEIFFNTSNRQYVNGETFDQNRLYVALGYRIAKVFDLEAGYMWQYLNRKSGLPDVNNHIGQIAVYWRK